MHVHSLEEQLTDRHAGPTASAVTSEVKRACDSLGFKLDQCSG